jgi:threonine aldolase
MPKDKKIDLRSDTKTLPTEEMLNSILEAELGDDVFGEDPTVNRLEELAAKKFGKEAGLLVTSGTQGNLIAVLSQTLPGDEVFLESQAHIYYYEVGAISAIGGVTTRTIDGVDGYFTPEQLEGAIRYKDIHFPVSKLVSLENTFNRAGGKVITKQQLDGITDIAVDHNLKVHLDGARIFNAATALNTTVDRLTENIDTIQFCLSKGLSAPVGSLVVGDEETIEIARKKRKILGGGMRQAGIIAAPGIIAIEKMSKRLHEDHTTAKQLASGLSEFQGLKVKTPDTNIVVVDFSELGFTGTEAVSKLASVGVLSASPGGNEVRLVTYRHISQDDISEALHRLEKIFTK